MAIDKNIQLIGEWILLRAYRPDDVDGMYEAINESVPEISLWMDWCHPGYAREESETWIKSQDEPWEKGTAYSFTIIEKKSGIHIGGCGINQINTGNKFANLGYWVRTSQTKQGVATAATLLLAEWGFRELKLNRIEIIADTGNKISQHVAEKAGAKREGVLRNRLVIKGSPVDAVMFSLTPADFKIK
jgi:ribosomal-protein-serine acetyltransferase